MGTVRRKVYPVDVTMWSVQIIQRVSDILIARDNKIISFFNESIVMVKNLNFYKEL